MKSSNSMISVVHHPFEWLPTCIYLIIREYITLKELQNLLNSSISIFLGIKKDGNLLRLGFDDSIRYCRNESFRHLIQSKVHNPRNQISLDLYSSSSLHLPKCYTNGCKDGLYKLMIRGIEDPVNLSYFSGITHLCIQAFSQIKTLKNLCNIIHLSIYDCENLFSLASLTKNCPDLQSVIISNCRRITSTHGIGHVPFVTLEYMHNIKDMSDLGHRQKFLVLKEVSNNCENVSNLFAIPFVEAIRCRHFPVNMHRPKLSKECIE